MVLFLLSAAGLVAVTLLLLLRPWRRRGRDPVATARDINASIYRDQLAELDRDLAAGTIAAADHAQSRAELQRRLLDDAAVAEGPVTGPGMRRSSWLIALAFPVLAAGMYSWLGSPDALDPQVRAAPSQGEVEKMVAGLAAKLEKNPDDPRGWTVLARSYRVMGKLPEAARAFSRIGPALERDPALLVEYADVLAAQARGDLEGKPLQLVAQALAIEPNNVMALSLAATGAYNRKDMAQATALWERALKLVPPESDDAKWLNEALAEVRKATGATASAATAANSTPAGSTPAGSMPASPAPVAATPQVSITGQVSLAPALAAQVKPGDTVFVFARAVDGPRMPLAVQRLAVADLPYRFTLDDSTAMRPEFKLSGAAQVRIEARVSATGSATPGPGDLIGTGPVVKPGAQGVQLVIDQVRP
jgi:cytochrome c-type biogenesis protein CcmH